MGNYGAFFHNLACISEKTDFHDFLSEMYLWTKKVPIKFWKSFGSGLRL